MPFSSCLPTIFKGAYPSFSKYSIFAPSSFKASTKIFIGLFFILWDPVNTISEFSFTEKYAVKKRIAVPACPIFISFELLDNACCINLESSEFERFSIFKFG